MKASHDGINRILLRRVNGRRGKEGARREKKRGEKPDMMFGDTITLYGCSTST